MRTNVSNVLLTESALQASMEATVPFSCVLLPTGCHPLLLLGDPVNAVSIAQAAHASELSSLARLTKFPTDCP